MSYAYGSSGTLRLPDVALLPHVFPQSVESVPVVGQLLAHLDPLTILAVLAIAVLPFLLGATRFGLWIRATGNAAPVMLAVGLKPKLLQEASTAFAGFFAGLAARAARTCIHRHLQRGPDCRTRLYCPRSLLLRT
ncbi:hypothetical protein OEG86_09780 [Hoeflea alexandrii]|uniref:ABC transporter permease subunit n=1 Tax=Hoeflea alexandrii TaxID=288436 RepID=UPI00226EB55C|nr:hypothetical protein [Hoeflea alexandrii]MCY0152468.1 hypothetical protein [Hoeflea alexandrii]